jgi:HAD superfamily 5'-nucleotidase-like hydrolase
MTKNVYVNRTLNLKKIKYVGLDMDHTLIRYRTDEFERISHTSMKEKLVHLKGYPKEVLKFPFDYSLVIRGLVIDRKLGNILKVNRHSAIRASHHGLKPIDFKTQQKVYQSTYIDLGEPKYLAIDTSFSLSLAILYAQLIDLKSKEKPGALPEFDRMADDVLQVLDEGHRDGSVKEQVKNDLNRFILKDEALVDGLEKFRRHGKKIFIVTNSDFHYTKLLLDFAIQPFLKDASHWSELFEIVITSASKPRFFYDKLPFLKVNPEDGTMTNYDHPLKPGIFQGGCAKSFTKDLGLNADEILYIGDHIYGDILRLKKDSGWRTAMVIDELDQEIEGNKKAVKLNKIIDELMEQKEPLEEQLTSLMTVKADVGKGGRTADTGSGISDVKTLDAKIESLQNQITEIDAKISSYIKQQQSFYNPNWGQLMRAGNEESYFAHQVDRFACVYMAKLSDLFALSPRNYFRAIRRPLAHELNHGS